MKKLLLSVILFAFSAQGFSQQANSPDTLIYAPHFTSLRTLDLIIVSKPAAFFTPYTLKSILPADIEALNGRDPSFLLAQTSSVTNYSDAGSFQGHAHFMLRGIDQSKINLTLDGIPLNEPENQGIQFSNLADLLNSASALSITRGAGISKNGVANYAGSIQITGPRPEYDKKLEAGSAYGSFNTTRNYIEYSSGLKNQFAWYGRASQVYSDGYKYNSASNSQSGLLSASYFHGVSKYKLNLIAGNEQNGLAWLGVSDSLVKKDRRTNANGPEKDHFTQATIQFSHTYSAYFDGNRHSVNSAVWYSAVNGNYDFDPNSFAGIPSANEMFNYDLRSDWLGAFSNYSFDIRDLIATVGIQGNIYKQRHTGSESSSGQLYQNTGFKNEVSGFVKAEYNANKIRSFVDLQVRYASFDYSGSVKMNDLSWLFFNPKAGISYNIKDNLILYYSAGSTGREPARNDIFGGNDNLLADNTGAALLFNTKAERVTDQELGFRVDKRALKLDVNVYYMDFRNEIVLDGKFGANGMALTSSVDKSFRSGAEVSITYQPWNFLKLINNSSYNESRVKEQNTSFTPILTPRFIINQEIAYIKRKFSISIAYRFQERSYINSANTAFIGSYHLLNGKVAYEGNKLGCSLQVGNITNSKYYNQGYVETDGTRKVFVQAPLNFLVAVKYRIF